MKEKVTLACQSYLTFLGGRRKRWRSSKGKNNFSEAQPRKPKEGEGGVRSSCGNVGIFIKGRGKRGGVKPPYGQNRGSSPKRRDVTLYQEQSEPRGGGSERKSSGLLYRGGIDPRVPGSGVVSFGGNGGRPLQDVGEPQLFPKWGSGGKIPLARKF